MIAIVTEKNVIEVIQSILGHNKFNIFDKLIDIGFNSLKAIELEYRLFELTGIEISIEVIFKSSSINEIIDLVVNHESNKAVTLINRIKKITNKPYYECSSAQKRMYALNKFDNSGINYNVSSVTVLNGELDVARLNHSFNELIKRHETLRTSFRIVDGEVVQYIHDDIELSIPITEAEEGVAEALINESMRPFDLEQAPLIRVELIKLSEVKHILVIDTHHIINDGISGGILWHELTELYNGNILPEQKIQYKDFSAWQNEKMWSEQGKQQEKYWLETFSGELPVLNLHNDFVRPAIQSFDGGSVDFKLNKEVQDRIKSLMRTEGATMHMVLLSSLNVLLSKYAGQEDIVIGTPIAGRRHGDLENVVGMFVNTLAMRNYPEGSKTFRNFLQEVKHNALKAYENQDYQFEELVTKLNIKRDMSRNPLFDVMFALQETNVKSEKMSGLEYEDYCGTGLSVAKFDITLTAINSDEEIYLNIEYCTKLFRKDTIIRMASHFERIVELITENPDICLNEIDMLGEAERVQILYDFNDTTGEYPKDKTIHELFEEQAEKTPNNIALVFEDKQLTYRELNEKSNQLARILRAKGVKPDDLVGIMVERSLEMIVGILGILKSGGAYVPIDPEYPAERIRFMLTDSGAKILLTQSWLNENVKNYPIDVISLDRRDNYSEDVSNPELINNPSDLIYCIYTSGSTGMPKGVLIEHRNAANLIFAQMKNYRIFNYEKILLFFQLTFDASVEQIFLSLLTGATLHLTNNKVLRDANKLGMYIQTNKISHLGSVSSYLKNIDLSNMSEIKRITSGGDIYQQEIIEGLKGNPDLFNLYGPTEATVIATIYQADEKTLSFKTVPIGKPIGNTQVYILDNYNRPQPIAISGELCISGAGLARSYLNRPELTAEKFVANPFIPGDRMYRTGDLARWLPDGNIEYLGRIDNQVKIRGYRIELGEIEGALLENEHLTEALVLAKEDNDGMKYLSAYIVANKELTVKELKEYLALKLPNYMIPSYFTSLDSLPVTPNGKVDRKALLDMEFNVSTGLEYEPPSNETEEKLVEIWQELLHLEKISVEENFFDLGGQSLKAIVLLSKISQAFDMELSLSEVFGFPTIKGLAARLTKSNTVLLNSLNSLIKLSYGQDGIIFAFPPAFGYGIAFKELGEKLKNYTLYGIDFIDNNKNGIQEYISLIKSQSPNGPYQLIAYSAGSKLAFEVAKMLEEVGDFVSNLIFIDSDIRIDFEKDYFVQSAIEYLSKKREISVELELTDNFINKNDNYVDFLNSINISEPIKANLHLILSDDNDNDYSLLSQFTLGSFCIHNGYGKHFDMLSGNDLTYNADIIQKIIDSVAF
ncbi:MAG: amino acid adenylation domain-containing protein [Lachnospiraceae bacterium]|nr:amino acid adenylation domain-containing protein [Lachnospiraceae bacterium]